jgi:hypothetical protein
MRREESSILSHQSGAIRASRSARAEVARQSRRLHPEKRDKRKAEKQTNESKSEQTQPHRNRGSIRLSQTLAYLLDVAMLLKVVEDGRGCGFEVNVAHEKLAEGDAFDRQGDRRRTLLLEMTFIDFTWDFSARIANL